MDFHPPIDWTKHRLHAAAASGNKTAVAQMTAEGADVNKCVNELLPTGEVVGTPLHVAVQCCPWNSRYVQTAKWLPEQVFTDFHTIAESLLLADAKIDTIRGYSGTALHDAARKGLVGIARLLVGHGADINSREDYEGRTPLHVSAENGQLEMVDYLLVRGVEVDPVAVIHDRRVARRKGKVGGRMHAVGTTPLELAAREGHRQVVKALIEAGAKLGRASAIEQVMRSKLRIEERFSTTLDLLSQDV